MVWWRRETLHERLAREGGLIMEPDVSEPSRPPWDKAGIHGMSQPRRWDAVVTVSAPDLPGDELTFVALADGTLVVEGDSSAEALAPLADAVEESLTPPFRAEAVRRTQEVWAVAARSIEVAELPAGTPGEAITISVQGGERTTVVDGAQWLASFPALEALAQERGLEDYVLEASSLHDELWEIRLSPL
jgi:hypothetical protein